MLGRLLLSEQMLLILHMGYLCWRDNCVARIHLEETSVELGRSLLELHGQKLVLEVWLHSELLGRQLLHVHILLAS